jgi:hypothetical protein
MANKSQDSQELPNVPTFNVPKKTSAFSGNKGFQNKGFSGTRFVPPQIRITQNKGGGGK